LELTRIAEGVQLVDIPAAGLSILCGCPENAVKRLIKAGIIREVERGGARFETGPNAILLSETPLRGGRFANLAEFPVLQMLYKQGMILPGHPNNTGRKPMIIGLRDQVEAQSRYIYAGNYGLGTVRELEDAGASPELAAEFHRMKLRFAFGSIKTTEELLDLRVIDCHAIELGGGAFVRRRGVNRYEFLYGGESLEVDLGVDASAAADGPPYELPRSTFSRDLFSVVHLGEGDGWDPDRPCMSSLVVWRGDPYLIDAGPDIEASLKAAGLGPGELRGVFMTHAHDDHFVGLTALMRGRRRLEYYAVPWVRASVQAKLRALTGMGDRDFRRLFDVRDLAEGEWNDLGGLEVMPVMSPHPVETTILSFRAGEGAERRSYAHLADLASFAVLDSMVDEDPARPGISRARAEASKAAYLEPADVKKIDSGGGMIHGDRADFAADASGIIYVSHTSKVPELPASFRGAVAAFGAVDRLIPGLAASPPREAPVTASDLQELAAGARLLRFEAGQRLCAESGPSILLISSGRAMLVAGERRLGELDAGDLFGEEAVLVEGCCAFEAVAESRVEACLIPAAAIEAVPALLWRLRELLDGRLAAFKGVFSFAWRQEYSVLNAEVDEQHRRLFALIDALDEGVSSLESCIDEDAAVAKLEAFARFHFETEERLMEASAYPGLAEHRREHELLRAELGGYRRRLTCGDAEAASQLDGFLKDWILRHTLLIDRQYMPYIGEG
jgi:hemerythrin-like metal-binding protein